MPLYIYSTPPKGKKSIQNIPFKEESQKSLYFKEILKEKIKKDRQTMVKGREVVRNKI